ncbi:hypothetical protein MFLAVUS_001160 [Mucor flavus]|uniref:non-specific serine/threonine protein kinase n=1 Tax=Mucor flavus TaxID=439312 RepID=A0ABP9YLQ0_9FUNG
MKTLRGRHKDGYVVIKLFVKPESGMSLLKQVKKFNEEQEALQQVPNAFYFQRILNTKQATLLVRQYLYSSLYDRISTRPFLTIIEKKWIAYQLLRGVADSHSKSVYHGDIKTENVLVTSWNWAFLVDYAFYKPTYLPEDNPADFSFFFDTSHRRTCYIAPERFYKSGTEIDHRMKELAANNYKSELTPAMDIFSVGCVIAELFLEGTPLFTLSQLFKYRSGEYNPNASLEKIEDKNIRDMVKHMIQIDPTSRLTAEEYLSEWHGKAFPHYFYSFLYQYMSSLIDKVDNQHQQPESTIMSALSSAYPSVNSRKLTDADEKIELIFYDFEKIMYFISFPCDDTNEGEKRRARTELSNTTTASSILFPPTSNILSYSSNDADCSPVSYKPGEEGSLILLSFVCSLIRNTLYPSSKLKALDILLGLAERLPDDVKLDRLVPYLIVLLTDESSLVRANTIKTLTQVLCMVESISPINARIFPEYIIPSIRSFSTDPDVLVRSTYASCIALIAETALRFLEMTQLLKADNVYPINDMDSEDLNFESAYDSSLQDLHAVIQEQATILLIDSESSVKRALLTNITCLCVFFGRQKANDVLLSHMITYLNDKDWMLRSAFFESIKGVGTFVGARSLEEYILPLMIQALTDAEEFVVEKVLNSLTSLADLGLFQKMKLWELVRVIWPLLCHPNAWIRNGAVGFIASTAKHLPKTDLWCIVYPMIRPFLRSDIAEINEETLLQNIETPVPRQVYEQAIIWATKATAKSNFWKLQNTKPPKESLAKKSPRSPSSGSAHRQTSLFNSFMVEEHHDNSQEDEMYIERLRTFGMSTDDEEKLRFMREYVFKVSKTKMSRPKTADDFGMERGEVLLKNLNVTPMTVFLPDLSQKLRSIKLKTTQTLPIKSSDHSQKASTSVIPRSITESRPRDDVCKLSRIANQPHIRALSPNTASKESHYHHERSSSIPIMKSGSRTFNSPIPSPSDYAYGSSIPKSLERPKSIILTMDAIKGKNARIGDPVELSLLSQDKQSSNDETYPKDYLEDISSVGYAHLQKLLYKIAMEAFPPHIPEFSADPAVMKRIRRLTQGTPISKNINNWKPEGTLVAHFTEHTATINQLAISWDNLLFASCSDDGSVRIWDCSRLERNVTNRSRATYNQQGGRIKCLTFIEQTYSIAAASDNGSIHVFRVDIRNAGPALKFSKCVTVREYQLVDEHAIILKHFTSNASNTMAGSKSILMFATTKGNIYGLDLLTMEIIWKLQNSKSHGIITAMTVDRLHTWLLVGTMRGILTMYDLRFQFPLRSWLHPSKSRISALVLNHDPRTENKHVMIAAGRNEISVWDIVTLQCVEVFAVKAGDEKTTGVMLEAYKALEAPSDTDILVNSFTNNESNFTENSVRAIASPFDCKFMITGGSDRKIRFWDTSRVENSGVVLGLDIDEAKPRYSTNTFENMKFHFEFTHSNRNQNTTNVGSRTGFNASNQAGNNNAIAQQQYLLRNHTDAITDIILVTETTYPLIISADRDGVIKVVS